MPCHRQQHHPLIAPTTCLPPQVQREVLPPEAYELALAERQRMENQRRGEIRLHAVTSLSSHLYRKVVHADRGVQPQRHAQHKRPHKRAGHHV
jgi:hypothetical protein